MPAVDRWRALGLKEIVHRRADAGEAGQHERLSRRLSDRLLRWRQGADIVVTGRCVDSAVTLGACIHEFGWTAKDYDRLAGGSLAGHIVECGAQACGGIFNDWEQVPDWDKIGYAIAEIAEDGSFVATKPEGTGGLVSPGTVGEQMLYEIGDPQAYLLPDVACDFSGVRLAQIAPDRVSLTGARGKPPTGPTRSRSPMRTAGASTSMLAIAGIDAAAKARRVGESVLKRMEGILRQRNWGAFEETSIEILGAEDSYGPHKREVGAREATLKLAAKHRRREPLEIMVRELTSSGTSFAPAFTGYGGTRAKASPVVRHFSTLVPKTDVPVTAHLGGATAPVGIDHDGGFDPASIERPRVPMAATHGFPETVPLIRPGLGALGRQGQQFQYRRDGARSGLAALYSRRPDGRSGGVVDGPQVQGRERDASIATTCPALPA
jgi:hypothetical protein